MPDNYWHVPRIWDGSTVYVLGGGPSLSDIDLTRLKGRRVIAVNCAFKLGQFDICFFGDGAFVERYGEGLSEFSGLKVTRRAEYLGRQDIKVIKQHEENRIGLDWPVQVEGISTDPDLIRWNGSSGACAINLAVLLGAKRIILFGFDMQKVEERHNWHNYYPDNDVTAHVSDYADFRKPFAAIARDLKTLGIECVNATPGSALTAFPIVTAAEALEC